MSPFPTVRPTVAYNLLIFFALFVAVLVIQLYSGAYGGERGNYSDEAAHFMNGLLVRDYITDGLGQNPMAFAEQYYLSYPKIAPGMWPPLFHVTLGLFALSRLPPFVAALLLLALATTWTAWRLFGIVSAMYSRAMALLIASAFLVTAMVVDLTSAVMVDMVVAACALEATYWIAIYFFSEDWRHAALFGLFCALGCLTKGNGVAIALVPLLMLLFTGKFRLLRHSGLYVAAGIVVVLAVPPLAFAYHLGSSIGDFGTVGPAEVLVRLKFYGTVFWNQFGTLPLIVALIGFSYQRAGERGGRQIPFGPALKALAVAAVIFHLLNPHLAYAGRYMALAVAPLLSGMPRGVQTISGVFASPRWRRASQVILLTAVVVMFFAARPAWASRAPLGFRDTVEFLQSRGLADRKVLIVSDENGEGAFVAEVAIRYRSPSVTVIRGSKLISSDDWVGHNFRLLFSSSENLMRELEDLHIDYLVVDRSVDQAAAPDRSQIDELVSGNQEHLEPIHLTVARRSIATYRLKYHSDGKEKNLRISLPYSLGRTLERSH